MLFAKGCLQLKGNAKSIHVAQLGYENKWLMDAISQLAFCCETWFEDVFEYLEPKLPSEDEVLLDEPASVNPDDVREVSSFCFKGRVAEIRSIS